jgi:hypothetical protein
MIKPTDTAAYALLKERAAANDHEFFEQVFRCNILFEPREVIGEAIKHSSMDVIEKWTDLNMTFALYELFNDMSVNRLTGMKQYIMVNQMLLRHSCQDSPMNC